MAVIPDDRAEVIARRFGTPGREFLDELPERLTRIVARWHLTLGRPLPVGIGGYLVNVQTQTGVDAVLKLSPTGGEQDRANELETYALRRWNGNAAVRLFMEDTTAGALLVERCAPGVTIDTLSDDDMLRAGCALARTLHRAPDAEDSRLLSNALHDVAARVQGLDGWMKRMGHPLSVGAESIVKRIHEDMPGAAAPIVVCHGDMNPGNVLSAHRAPWLAVDPMPLLAPDAYDAVSRVWSKRPWLVEQPNPEQVLNHRVELAATRWPHRRRACGHGRSRGSSASSSVASPGTGTTRRRS